MPPWVSEACQEVHACLPEPAVRLTWDGVGLPERGARREGAREAEGPAWVAGREDCWEAPACFSWDGKARLVPARRVWSPWSPNAAWILCCSQGSGLSPKYPAPRLRASGLSLKYEARFPLTWRGRLLWFQGSSQGGKKERKKNPNWFRKQGLAKRCGGGSSMGSVL